MTVDLLCGDVLTTEPGGLFHAMLCDPPYELGFMGRAWDKSGIAFDPATWARLGERLYPGAFGMAFASSRGWHRLACAIEDAGFVIHPTIFCWAFGSGFPKATRIDTQVDKAAGAEREVIGCAADFALDGHDRHGRHNSRPTQQVPGGDRWRIPITAPATPLTATWAGHRYGLQALKPATEPIVTFSKPLTGCHLYDILVEVQTLMEVFLCQFINARDAEGIFREAGRLQSEASTSIAQERAFLIARAVNLLPGDAKTVISPWLVEASTVLSIASSWSNILGASWGRLSASTTSTETEAITVLKILRSFLLTNTPEGIIPDAYRRSGLSSSAMDAVGSFNNSEAFCNPTPTLTVQGNVLGRVGSSTLSKPANDADESLRLQTSASIVLLDAITSAPASQEELRQLANSAVALFTNLDGTLRTSNITSAISAERSSTNPIIVFQKPYAGKPVDCITRTGAGAIWVDGGRIGVEERTYHGGGASQHRYSDSRAGSRDGRGKELEFTASGRWPANFILGDDDAAAALDRQCGTGDSGGGPSRFFYRVATALDEAEPVRYVAKASRRERDAGLDSYLTVKYNIAILDLGGVPCQSVAMATAALLQRVMSESTRSLSIVACGESIMAQCQKGGLSTTLTAIRKTIESRILPLLTLSLTNESTADASSLTASGGSHAESVESLRRWILTTIGGGMELARGVSLAASEMLLTISESGAWQEWKSSHPTHKPLDLCRYLATLLLPPAEYAPRRILVPFAGVCSEVIGAALAGWDEVVGIEREAEYVEIGRARIAHWCAQPALLEVSA